jgi:hypothetical protein
MVVNFKARGISQYTRKLTWTPILIKKKKKYEWKQWIPVSLRDLSAFSENLVIIFSFTAESK